MKVACIDFEGVLVPEIWLSLAQRMGIEALKLTTRDVPDYDELMHHRLDVMRERGLRFNALYNTAQAMEPLVGAGDFLTWLRERYQVAIVSDTFHELAAPLLAKLGYPQILCHRLILDDDGAIAGYQVRQPDPKRQVVIAFQSMSYEVVATGDSYNDISMLQQADTGMLFQPPAKLTADYPDFAVANDYGELRAMFGAAA